MAQERDGREDEGEGENADEGDEDIFGIMKNFKF